MKDCLAEHETIPGNFKPSGQHWPGPQNPARAVAAPAHPTGQTALSLARNLQKVGGPPARSRGDLQSACRFRAAERAMWPAGRLPRLDLWAP
eukprot:322733-Alexandrium_andersonii.AAC.1